MINSLLQARQSVQTQDHLLHCHHQRWVQRQIIPVQAGWVCQDQLQRAWRGDQEVKIPNQAVSKGKKYMQLCTILTFYFPGTGVAVALATNLLLRWDICILVIDNLMVWICFWQLKFACLVSLSSDLYLNSLSKNLTSRWPRLRRSRPRSLPWRFKDFTSVMAQASINLD